MGAMRVLLDTCTFIWLALPQGKLSPTASQTLNNPKCDLFLSDVSVWEITLKNASGKLDLPDQPRSWLPARISFFQLRTFRIQHEHFFRSCELQDHHPDPFDRLIAAQAIEGGMTILSPDYSFSKLGASRLW